MPIVNANVLGIQKRDESTDRNESDHIYYNVDIRKTVNNKGIADFNVNSVIPILKNPSDYDLAVVRFSVPANNLPIFLWEDNKYIVCLFYNGVEYNGVCEWFQNTPGGSYDWYGRAVWNYKDFVRSINTAFQKAYDALILDNPGAPITLPPEMVYSADSKRCTIYVPPEYSSDITVNPVEVWFNEGLSDKFPAFQHFGGKDPDFEDDPLDVRIKKIFFFPGLKNRETINGIDFIKSEEEYSTLLLWSDFKDLIFETSIPVVTETVGAQKANYRQILTDFEQVAGLNDRSPIQYQPSGLPRFYDMTSSYPLKRMDVRVRWQTKSGKIFPIRISDEDVLTIKLYFKRKGLMIDY